MVLSVLRKLILQTRMRSHPVGLDVLFFVYFHTSCVRTVKALVRLRAMRWLAWAIAGTVAYVISIKISWAGSNFVQIKTLRGLEITAMWGPLPISMVLRSEGSPGELASQLGTDAWKKKKKKKTDEKVYFFFFQAGQCAALSSFRVRKMAF